MAVLARERIRLFIGNELYQLLNFRLKNLMKSLDMKK